MNSFCSSAVSCKDRHAAAEAPSVGASSEAPPAIASGSFRAKISKDTPIGKAVEMYHEKMPSSTKRKYLSSMREGIRKGVHSSSTASGSEDVSIGSACSGSEIAYICMEVILNCICNILGLTAGIRHAFACESNPGKRAFIQAQFQPVHVFGDVAELTQRTAMCFVKNAPVQVPWCFFFLAGFSCKSRSSVSSKSAANVNCIQRQDMDTETSYTWEHTFAYIAKALPVIILLENITALQQKPNDGSLSDCDYIIEQLRSLGYHVVLYRFDAECLGSRASRWRLYFIGWLVRSGALTQGPFMSMVQGQFQWLEGFLDGFCIGPLPVDWFIAVDEATLAKFEKISQIDLASHRRDTGEAWQTEHMEFYREKGFAWPVELHPGSAAISKLRSQGVIFQCKTLTSRQSELLFFCHQAFPRGVSCNTVEFLDVGPSMGRLFIADGDKSPWKIVSQTIVGASIMCVRYKQGDVIVVRDLLGVDMFNLIGFDSSFLIQPAAIASSLLINMGGNTVSAFAVAPMIMVALAGAGIIDTLGVPPVEASDTDSVIDLFDDSSDSGEFMD